MREFTKEMLDTLTNAHKELKDTIYCNKYRMSRDTKLTGRWESFYKGIPCNPGKIKTIGLATYIIAEDKDGILNRFLVTYNVKELLNI